ncbi:hypothetical protein Poly51_03540 [Rubripirellula tenax]|uniref:Uncharacterized protein n=1 Tax=Rubripirellula tenax TaxID=2528015 RepID=A0A5C6FGV3_9BACT|nr:hypothetical protein Poly51_03540 [Rubripirellula tenax]
MHSSSLLHDEREAFGSACNRGEELRSRSVPVQGSKLVLVRKRVLERKQVLVRSKLVRERKQEPVLRSKPVREHMWEHKLAHKRQPCNVRTTCRSNLRPNSEPRSIRPKRTSQTKQSTSFLPPRG